ncbi:YeiH family protein [Anaeromyxobacter paludicola]|uniref:Membrane protein n=1 Tax=Anaeromyxobacter paludicola TaxID=2918171 RepID=A0ABM7X7R6_9BACT|nr:putative sulfate exporter family transporter [Anaeromyxobacter paludicola]BDG07885.1 membrane protein [Anaeromyxobacter paludicola]
MSIEAALPATTAPREAPQARRRAVPPNGLPLLAREDTWAMAIALGLVLAATLTFFAGSRFFGLAAVSVPGWSGAPGKVLAGLLADPRGLVSLFALFLATFAVAGRVMGWPVRAFAAGFAVLFLLALVVTVLGSNATLKGLQLETPLLALLVGLLIGNLAPLPRFLHAALRTEFYVKTGIVLMGATLPFTVILQAGPLAIAQASIVSLVTFVTIHLAATRLFGLDPRLGACLGAGGSICGVSGAIAIGGACRAEKEHVSVAISMVIVWAVAMIFALPAWARHLGMAAGPTGAWIGTSEFADAAGFAAASAVGDERAIKTFTLMKVVGRDMFVGVWAVVVAFLSITRWERRATPGGERERVAVGEVWRRFPKFVLGFLAASLAVTVTLALLAPKVGAQYAKEAIGPLKSLRGWAFTFTFLSIGLTTRFRELKSFGWRPLAAFAVGVAVNVPLGYWLSNSVFASYWLGVK